MKYIITQTDRWSGLNIKNQKLNIKIVDSAKRPRMFYEKMVLPSHQFNCEEQREICESEVI
jgi:hypothetical protein